MSGCIWYAVCHMNDSLALWYIAWFEPPGLFVEEAAP